MKKKNQRRLPKGFTLIELLVVVLIIGILAAVALPQYQVAVLKSRVATYMPVVKALIQAEETYYLENGNYTYDLTALDIDIPMKGCTYKSAGYYACPGPNYIGIFDGPTNAQWNNGFEIAYLQFFKDTPSGSYSKGQIACFSSTETARKVCRTLGEGTESDAPHGSWKWVYKLNNP